MTKHPTRLIKNGTEYTHIGFAYPYNGGVLSVFCDALGVEYRWTRETLAELTKRADEVFY
jgi:hypothetical protein